MLVLFETPAGYALFKVTDEAKLASPDELHKHFESADSAARIVKLKAFSKFADTVEVSKRQILSQLLSQSDCIWALSCFCKMFHSQKPSLCIY